MKSLISSRAIKCSPSFLLFVLWILSTVVGSQSVHADSLQDEMRGVAAKIAKVPAVAETQELQIGLFQSKDKDPSQSSYGKRIIDTLREQLGLAGVKISRRAPIRVFGEFTLDRVTGKVIVEMQLINTNEEVKGKIGTGPISIEISDTKDVLLVSHATAVIPPNPKPEEVIEIAKKSLKAGIETLEPPKNLPGQGFLKMEDLPLAIRLVEVDPTKSASDPEFIKKPIEPIKNPLAEGTHFQFAHNQHFAVEVLNLDPTQPFVFELFVDGVNTFALSEKFSTTPRGEKIPEFQHWAVFPLTRTLVPGWYKTSATAASFQIVPDDESVAARTGNVDSIGVIQLLISAAWEKGKEPPNPNFKLLGKRGVGEGKTFQAAVKPVELEIGCLLGSFSVQYQQSAQPAGK
jgi:hypothetical protein